MRAEFLNPFIKSVVKILEDNTGEKPLLEKPFLRASNTYTTEPVSIIIGVTGQLAGQVIFSIEESCARGIAAAMMMEDALPVLDSYAQSALAELSNMIVANATIELNDVGCECDITPPTVISGKRMEIRYSQKTPTIAIPLKMKNGKIEVNLSLIEDARIIGDQKLSSQIQEPAVV